MANEGQNKYTGFPIELLKAHEAVAPNNNTEQTANRLVEMIGGYLKTAVAVSDIVVGPTVTRYEFELPEGVELKKAEALRIDIKDELAPMSNVRIEAPIYGKRTVGVEIPNPIRSIVGLREGLSSPKFVNHSSPLVCPVGKDTDGNIMLLDLTKMPNLFIAGQSGSGKSVFINAMVASIMYKASPDDARFIMIGERGIELSVFQGMPHMLFGETITHPDDALNALGWANDEMNKRYLAFNEYKCHNLAEYNRLQAESESGVKLPHIVIVIHELLHLARSKFRRAIEDKIASLVAMGRAAGIHVVISSLYASSDVIAGTIKANMTSRIAFRVPSSIDSRMILDVPGAETLIGSGDMLYYPMDVCAPVRVQGSYIAFKELQSIIGYIKKHNRSDYNEAAADSVFKAIIDASDSLIEDEDSLLPAVTELAIKLNNISTPVVQRRFSIGYARAARIIDRMEALGFIGPIIGYAKPRDVLITREQYKKFFGRDVQD